jgi:hypothetical protein
MQRRGPGGGYRIPPARMWVVRGRICATYPAQRRAVRGRMILRPLGVTDDSLGNKLTAGVALAGMPSARPGCRNSPTPVGPSHPATMMDCPKDCARNMTALVLPMKVGRADRFVQSPRGEPVLASLPR